MDAFDADVLIYAAVPGHRWGRRVAALFPDEPAGGPPAGVGSTLLLPEVLSKPLRDRRQTELAALSFLLSRLDLRPLDRATANLAVALAAAYGLRAADAAHLATAVQVGADRYITHNAKDFTRDIAEITVTYPEDLPDPGP